MTRSIMIQGTTSDAGKSFIAAALCRILHQEGIDVAPFKSQNMALNSYITLDGLEMGRAQAMQAEAAGIEPDVRMNPILLKPEGDSRSQVIVDGEVTGSMTAREYYAHQGRFLAHIRNAYASLSAQHEMIVLEGAGSPAEINLTDCDMANMRMAHLATAPVLLCADIDRGGVFASLYGTMALLGDNDRPLVKGTIINRFRGDVSILEPGLKMLEGLTDVPVLGVIPMAPVHLDEEDSLSTPRGCSRDGAPLDIAVIRLPHISNFTDFAPLTRFEDVSLRFVTDVKRIGKPDLVIIPGTKTTLADLRWMEKAGIGNAIVSLAGNGTPVLGICGGYQMLGMRLDDPLGVEGGNRRTDEGGGLEDEDGEKGDGGLEGEDGEKGGGGLEGEDGEKGDDGCCNLTDRSVRGLGLLPVATVFTQHKTRDRVRGAVSLTGGTLRTLSGAIFEGYEMHMGTTRILQGDHEASLPAEDDVCVFSRISPIEDGGSSSGDASVADGCITGNIAGTYCHGIFEAGDLAERLVGLLMERRGLHLTRWPTQTYHEYKERQYDALADIVRASLDMDAIRRIIEEGI